MSDMHPQGTQQHVPEDRPHHQRTDLRLRPIIMFGIGLIVLAAVVHVVLGWFMSGFERATRRNETRRPVLYDDERGLYPGPNNQVHPRMDLETYRAKQLAEINRYRWADEKARVAEVPVDRALDILAEKGLPKVKNIPPHGAKTEKPK